MIEKFRQIEVYDKVVAFDDIGLRLRHRLVRRAAGSRSCAR
jgi:hypothetical protein